MLASVRDSVRETAHGLRGKPGKFQGETAFAIYSWEQLAGDSSSWDEETGDVEFGRWSGRIGRRVWSEDNFGFVSYTRFDDEAHAKAWFDAEAYDYHVWNGHQWGDVEESRIAGTFHRKCEYEGCNAITLDLEDDDE